MSETETYQPVATRSVAELIAEQARADAAAELVGEYRDEIRAQLREALERLEGLTGAAATSRAPDGTATITNPQPKLVVSDAQAFAEELLETGLEELVVLPRPRTRVAYVGDPQRLFDALECDDDDELRDAAEASVDVTTDFVLPGDALAQVEALTTPSGDGLVWTVGDLAGSPVRGVSVKPARARTLTVRVSKDAKLRHRTELEERLAGTGLLGTSNDEGNEA